MDILNDHYPYYPYINENEYSDEDEYIKEIFDLKRLPHIDEWNIHHSDDLWYLWCTVKEYISINHLPFLDNPKFDYPAFCDIIYKNSTKR